MKLREFKPVDVKKVANDGSLYDLASGILVVVFKSNLELEDESENKDGEFSTFMYLDLMNIVSRGVMVEIAVMDGETLFYDETYPAIRAVYLGDNFLFFFPGCDDVGAIYAELSEAFLTKTISPENNVVRRFRSGKPRVDKVEPNDEPVHLPSCEVKNIESFVQELRAKLNSRQLGSEANISMLMEFYEMCKKEKKTQAIEVVKIVVCNLLTLCEWKVYEILFDMANLNNVCEILMGEIEAVEKRPYFPTMELLSVFEVNEYLAFLTDSGHRIMLLKHLRHNFLDRLQQTHRDALFLIDVFIKDLIEDYFMTLLGDFDVRLDFVNIEEEEAQTSIAALEMIFDLALHLDFYNRSKVAVLLVEKTDIMFYLFKPAEDQKIANSKAKLFWYLSLFDPIKMRSILLETPQTMSKIILLAQNSPSEDILSSIQCGILALLFNQCAGHKSNQFVEHFFAINMLAITRLADPYFRDDTLIDEDDKAQLIINWLLELMIEMIEKYSSHMWPFLVDEGFLEKKVPAILRGAYFLPKIRVLKLLELVDKQEILRDFSKEILSFTLLDIFDEHIKKRDFFWKKMFDFFNKLSSFADCQMAISLQERKLASLSLLKNITIYL